MYNTATQQQNLLLSDFIHGGRTLVAFIMLCRFAIRSWFSAPARWENPPGARGAGPADGIAD